MAELRTSGFTFLFVRDPNSSLYLSDVDITPRDPRWVGAWWIGFIIIAILMSLWTFPVLLFPPRLPGQTSGVKSTNMKELARGKKAQTRLQVAFPAKLNWNNESFCHLHEFIFLSDLPRAFVRLAKNPLYICLVVGMSFDIYMTGFYTFLPKYLEKHFLKTPALASVYAGKCVT